MHSRRLLASATSDHPDAALGCDAIKIAASLCGGRAAVDGVIFHTDRGSTYTATVFTMLCRKLGVSQSMGRVGSCFDNAAAEAFFSTLEHEVLSPAPFHHQSPGTPGRGGVVPGLLQHPAPAQLGDAPSRSARRGRTAPPHYWEGGGPRAGARSRQDSRHHSSLRTHTPRRPSAQVAAHLVSSMNSAIDAVN
ncbi:MAG: DDE-type integrase/transposase/recombinase, partial [Mycobacterium sp.]